MKRRTPVCRWTFLWDFSRRPRLLPRVPSRWTVLIYSQDFATSNPEVSRYFVLGTPECRWTPDLHHVSQPMDGPDSISGFRDLRCPDDTISLSTQNPGSRNTDGFSISATCLNRWTTQIDSGIFTMKIPDLLSS
jgi:hypothetical protein